MNPVKPLTEEQRIFAEQNHDLIYAFLHHNHLPKGEYYDVVVFGYLRALVKYFEGTELRRYSFSTIAWKTMQSELSNHRKYQSRHIPSGLVSLQDTIESGEYPQWSDRLAQPDDLMIRLEMDMLLHAIAKGLPKRHAQAVVMKANGYNLNEIGKAMKMRNSAVKGLIAASYETVRKICYGK